MLRLNKKKTATSVSSPREETRESRDWSPPGGSRAAGWVCGQWLRSWSKITTSKETENTKNGYFSGRGCWRKLSSSLLLAKLCMVCTHAASLWSVCHWGRRQVIKCIVDLCLLVKIKHKSWSTVSIHDVDNDAIQWLEYTATTAFKKLAWCR